jgi:glycine dehydrogenase subunit 1
MDFVPNTDRDKEEMMGFLGIKGLDELFVDIPEKIRSKNPLNVSGGMSEMELRDYMGGLSEENTVFGKIFKGAGVYNHFIPSVVGHIAGRSEFYTAYTPYQPETSQGILQAIYEYQTMICELTGMDVTNASMYDGASATAEAALMASGITRKREVVVSKAVHPEYRKVLQTYMHMHDMGVHEAPYDGKTGRTDLSGEVSDGTACVIVQNPNFFGCLENLGEIPRREECLLVAVVSEPTSLGILKPPGEFGADIVVGEGQSFGNSMSFGGPYLGFMATTQEHMRRIPGRLVGRTKDLNGNDGFLLTLQAREQHIRRERATSNICTNEALNALMATVYLAVLGKNGLRELAELNAKRAHYAAGKLPFELAFDSPFYNEFVVKGVSGGMNEKLMRRGVLGGLELERFYPELEKAMLMCVTEMNSKRDINELVEAMKG